MSRAPQLTGSVRLRDDATLVMLAGEIDLHSAPILRGLLERAVAAEARSVVIDMALVSFCDATGLGLLVNAGRQLEARGARLSLRATPAPLRRLLAITGLTSALHVEPVTPADDVLLADLMRVAQLPLTRGVLDAALKLVVRTSQSVMSGADGVSLTLPRDGRLRTVAASDDTVLEMDHDQYETGQGPCLDAATQGELFHSTALSSERRWPEFVPRARARGIESIMSTPLLSAGRPVGALNVYSRTPETLQSQAQQWAITFAEEASNVLLAADATTTVDAVDAGILEALHARQVIALAQGVVMARRDLPADAAHRFLIDISRESSEPLLSVCQDLLATVAPANRPDAPEGTGLGGARA